MASDLEDLGGDDDAGPVSDVGGGAASAPRPPDRHEIERLRREVDARMARARRTVADAQQSAGRWQKKAEEARALGSEVAAREADRNADLERARMHSALTELSEMTAELEALDRAAREAPKRRAAPPPGGSRPGAGSGPSRSDRAPPGDPSVDDLLRDLKRGQGGGGGQGGAGSGRRQLARPRGGPRQRQRHRGRRARGAQAQDVRQQEAGQTVSRRTALGWFLAVALALGLGLGTLPSCSGTSKRRSVHRVKTERSKKP